jgi:c(7)-type cytochrome triheme protein
MAASQDPASHSHGQPETDGNGAALHGSGAGHDGSGGETSGASWEFPRWTNRVVTVLAGVAGVTLLYGVAVAYFATEPRTVNVGYSPKQPVPFSHKTHAGKLKLDCRYCHNTVERSAHAAIPPTQTCGNCHSGSQGDGTVPFSSVLSTSPKLAPVRESLATGKSIPWVRVHDLPDFAYFDHSAHVNRGVGCVSCHGRVDRMDQVYQAQPLSMAWCLDCHRDPTPHLRPLDKITQMDWEPERDPVEVGREVHQQLNIKTSTNCSTCHR